MLLIAFCRFSLFFFASIFHGKFLIFMDLRNIFGLLRKLFVDPLIFLGFAIVFSRICQTF